MKTSRQRVLDYIQVHRAVTTSELCQALNSTEANMRHHLSILLEQGAVQVIGRRTSGNMSESAARMPSGKSPQARLRGRPARVFGPVDPSPAVQLASLAAALLDEILPGLSMHEQESFLERVARRVADGLIQAAPAPERPLRKRADSLTTRLFSTIEILNRANYQARWEARPDAPRLILSHCPFGDLAQQYPEICKMDARLIEILLEAPVEQIKYREKDARGLPYCLFRLVNKPSV